MSDIFPSGVTDAVSPVPHPSGVMAAEWSGPGWSAEVRDDGLHLKTPSGSAKFHGEDSAALTVKRRWFTWRIYLDRRQLLTLRGLSRRGAEEIRLALRRLRVVNDLLSAVDWTYQVEQCLGAALAQHRWVTTETRSALRASRPQQRLAQRVAAAECGETLTDAERRAVEIVDGDLDALISETNSRIEAASLVTHRNFFDTIEKSPLTDEQAKAVVCFDNRVQVVAAAGSGKTSVMVARAAYAVERGIVAPDRILLLAFNKAAANELQERIEARFAAAGIDSTGVRASTFHSFGLDVIGRATGVKPRLAPWLENGQDVEEILRIVDELSDGLPRFRYDWDLYRFLFAGKPTELNDNEPDGYDPESRENGYRTLAGEIVKSHGERLIADFLYLSGVNYVYEKPYEYEVADESHSQYRPDFYYPDIGVWHEHWAIDRDGKPPAEFTGYGESMEWKRQLHASLGTRLVETTWSDVVFGDGLAGLQSTLEAEGITFDWNPDRPIANKFVRPIEHRDLARGVRTFMTHMKSNAITRRSIEARLDGDIRRLSGFRTQLFLGLMWRINDGWERRLAAERCVDFEDMLLQAADHLETGLVDAPYDLVMVDEFQDASRARARLVRALVNKPNRYLLAVGDDWQSINRFAGADLSVMTDFTSWFGEGEQLHLTTTFRCPQTICDIASGFVSKNPAQFRKSMRSAQPDPGPPVSVIQSDDPAGALAGFIKQLSSDVESGRVQPGKSGRVTVDVLGRYNFNRDLLGRPPSNLEVKFRTIHGSKGLEADYIVLPAMNVGTYGFPSTIADDPVLALATPAPESFEHAEERRLFYVALTRARRQVTLIAPTKQMSPFVVELLDNPLVKVVAPDGSAARAVVVCNQCGEGTMVRREGKYGAFLGCSTFPKCRNTQRIA